MRERDLKLDVVGPIITHSQVDPRQRPQMLLFQVLFMSIIEQYLCSLILDPLIRMCLHIMSLVRICLVIAQIYLFM